MQISYVAAACAIAACPANAQGGSTAQKAEPARPEMGKPEAAKPKTTQQKTGKLSDKTKEQIAVFKAAHANFLKLYRQGRYQEAEGEVNTALSIARRLLGDKHPITATELHNLAALYTSTKRYEQAVPLFKEALAIREAVLKVGDPKTISTLVDLKTTYSFLQQMDKEYEILLRLRPLYDGKPPRDAKRLADTLNRLGVIQISAKAYEEAAVKLERAISLYEAELGRAHKDTAMAISNLAVVYTKQKRLVAALKLFDEVYATRRDVLGPDHDLTVQTMTEISEIADRLKQHDKALALAKKIVETNKVKLGANHIRLAGEHNRLAAYAFRAKNYDLAGRSLARAIEITQMAKGEDSPELLNYLSNLATLYRDLGRYKEAEPVYRRRIDILAIKHGKDAPKVVNALIHLGKLNRQIARYKVAEKNWMTALSLEQGRNAPKKTVLSAIYSNLGGLYREIGKYSESSKSYEQSLALHLAAKDARRDNLARLYDNMGVLNIEMNRLHLAEGFHKKALAIFEEVLGPEHRAVSLTLNNLATVYDYQSRNPEALKLWERSLAIYQKTARPADPRLGVFLDNLAGAYRKANRMVEAEDTYKKAMDALLLAYGSDHPEVALAMSNLASLYTVRKDLEGADRLYKKAIAINRKVYGDTHPQLANMWRLLGENDVDRKDYASAERNYQTALKIAEASYGVNHSKTGQVVVKLAALYLWQQDYDQALIHYRRAARIKKLEIATRNERGAEQGPSYDRGLFTGLAITNWHVAANGKEAEQYKQEGLIAAQQALRTSAGAALAQMSARFAAGTSELAVSVRQRQDLTRAYGRLDRKLLALLSTPPAKRDNEAIAQMRAGVLATAKQIERLDEKIKKEFPDYASLANPRPLKGEEIQSHLRPDEALIYFMTSNEAVYVWALTKNELVWNRVPLKRTTLRKHVALLRTALNPETANATRGLTPLGDPVVDEQPASGVKTSFDLTISHDLYKMLLAPLEDVIAEKRHLLIVAADALTGLPFQVLLTDEPPISGRNESEIYQRAPWLIKRHALTTLPSIASLKALRLHAGKSKPAEKALIGFGDPVFSKTEKPKMLAKGSGEFASYYRGGQVNLAALSQLSQLPDTKDELLNVARTLNVPQDDIKLGRGATETIVKALDKKGELARHRIVYFATHGLVSGDIKGLGEPALALSLPPKATDEDDGLLTASEVTQLHLNADWVVLSACNTASGGKPGAEALSGLARAFFYSGAKSLLVSHWPVYSDAATLLTTKAFKLIEEGQKTSAAIGRAEALRRSMLSLIEDAKHSSDGFSAHPSYWAPFVVVGEGAAAHP